MDSLVTEHDHQVVDKICRLINEVVTAFGTLLLSCLDDFCSLLGDFPSDDWDTTGKKAALCRTFPGDDRVDLRSLPSSVAGPLGASESRPF